MWFLRSMDGEVQRSEEIGTVQEFKPVAEARTKQESSWASQRDSRAQRRHHGRRPVRITSSSNGKNLNTFSQDGSRPRGEKKRAVPCWIAKLRELKPTVPIGGPHHNDVDSNAFEPVDAV